MWRLAYHLKVVVCLYAPMYRNTKEASIPLEIAVGLHTFKYAKETCIPLGMPAGTHILCNAKETCIPLEM